MPKSIRFAGQPRLVLPGSEKEPLIGPRWRDLATGYEHRQSER
jgi:hypothetical protein